MTTTDDTRAARERLAGLHSRMTELRTTISTVMARATAGESVDLLDISSAEAALSVAERILPSAQALAQAEAQAEQQAQWEPRETAALVEHHERAGDLHDKIDATRAALTEVVAAGVELNRAHRRYSTDPTRPAAVLTGVHPAMTGDVLATAAGERMHPAQLGAVLSVLLAEALDQVAAAGEPVPTRTHEALARAAVDLVMPADHRGDTDTTEGAA